MAFDQHFAQEWKSISAAAAAEESENISGCFDCSICLDFACDPVVTLCGHLYCWPCIYKWFNSQNASLSADEHPQCPVCKAEISPSTVVPLYGRGHNTKAGELEGEAPSLAIPPRPPACNTKALMSALSQPAEQFPYHNSYQNQQYSPHSYSGEDQSPSLSLGLDGSGGSMGVFHPMTVPGMFGEMVYARVFGNSERLFTYPNSYHLMGSNSPRLRRQEMLADKSLNRITSFLFCCIFLCLLLF